VSAVYPGLSATLRAERRQVVRAARRTRLEAVAGGRKLFAVNVYFTLVTLVVAVDSVVAELVMHKAAGWTFYLSALFLSGAATSSGMALAAEIREWRADR
jgi:hypothetical protein